MAEWRQRDKKFTRQIMDIATISLESRSKSDFILCIFITFSNLVLNSFRACFECHLKYARMQPLNGTRLGFHLCSRQKHVRDKKSCTNRISTAAQNWGAPRFEFIDPAVRLLFRLMALFLFYYHFSFFSSFEKNQIMGRVNPHCCCRRLQSQNDIISGKLISSSKSSSTPH